MSLLIIDQESIVKNLKEEYFELALKERYSRTPDITEALDCLEYQIMNLLYCQNDPSKEQEKLEG